MPEFDTLVRGGTVVDSTRAPRRRADVGISDGRIAAIGDLKRRSAVQRLDADGLIVAPGAIDLHTHYDAQIHWDPYCTIDGWHGVTSVTLGNCGLGFAPLRPADAERAMRCMTRNKAIPLATMHRTMAFDWQSFPQWMDHLEQLPLGVNVSQLVPLTPLLGYAMGGWEPAEARRPDADETARIVALLREAMAAGAVGWSSQRDHDGAPMPSDPLDDDFHLALARALGGCGHGFMQYSQPTAEHDDPAAGAARDRALQEKLALVSGRPLLFNAVVVDDGLPQVFRDQLRWLEAANSRGARIFGQASSVRIAVTFTLADCKLFDQSPAWREATFGAPDDWRARLASAAIRQAMKRDYDSGAFTRSRTGLPFEIEIASCVAANVARESLAHWQGRTLAQIAAAQGKHVIDAMLDLSLADELRTQWCTPRLNQRSEFARELMSSPYTLAGLSDGGAHMKLLTAGIWPTDLLGWMVRDTGMLSLEQAHWRLSGLPARAAGFADRGLLREGMLADMMIYDLAALATGPVESFDDLPAGEWRRVQRAHGYRWILVNGEVTFADGRCTGATPGRLHRAGS